MTEIWIKNVVSTKMRQFRLRYNYLSQNYYIILTLRSGYFDDGATWLLRHNAISYPSIWRHIHENCNLHINCHNLKFHIVYNFKHIPKRKFNTSFIVSSSSGQPRCYMHWRTDILPIFVQPKSKVHLWLYILARSLLLNTYIPPALNMCQGNLCSASNTVMD